MLLTTSTRNQWDRLGQDLIAEVRRQALLRKHVYRDAERLLQIILECDEVKEASTLRHVDEQIEVAEAARFAAGDRAEHADIPRAVGGRDPSDGVPCSRG